MPINTKIFKDGKVVFVYGFSFRRIGIGISLSRYSFDLEFIFFWISLEF